MRKKPRQRIKDSSKNPDFQENDFSTGRKISFRNKKTDFAADSKKSSPQQRKATLIILLLTLILVVFFWLKTQQISIFENIFKPHTIEIISGKQKASNTSKTSKEKTDSIKEFLKDKKGTYGIYVYNLNNNQKYGINEVKIFPAASINKVPVMLAFLSQLEKELYSLDDKYSLKSFDVQDYGTGNMRYKELGTEYTYDELLELSGKISDNTAAHVIGSILGADNIDKFIEVFGLQNTSIDNNETTPLDLGTLFALTYKGEILKKEKYKNKFFYYLTNTDFEDRIPAGVPEQTKVAHKIGNLEGVFNDCGIVFAENPYVLCILSKNSSEEEGPPVLKQLSSMIWEFEN